MLHSGSPESHLTEYAGEICARCIDINQITHEAQCPTFSLRAGSEGPANGVCATAWAGASGRVCLLADFGQSSILRSGRDLAEKRMRLHQVRRAVTVLLGVRVAVTVAVFVAVAVRVNGGGHDG